MGFTASCGSRKPAPTHAVDLKSSGGLLPLEAVNGVPIAVKEEAVAAVKGEPVVALRVELKWSPTLVRPQITYRTTSPACDR
jgi:hypothetical protein